MMQLPRMNAGARAFLDRLAAEGGPPIYTLPPEVVRRQHNARQAELNLPPLHACDMREVQVTDDVAARLYLPDGEGPAPLMVFFHGGGWMLGTLDAVDALCQDLCHQSGWAVLSVDYRLAPEHPFPAPIEDGRAALRLARSGDLGDRIDPTRLAVAGDSAGGNIAAVLALEEGRALTAQVLIYPVTDRSRTHGSMERLGKGLNLDKAIMDWFWDNYVTDPGLHGDWRVSPLCFSGTTAPAPTMVLLAGYDPLFDEGLAYADHLAGLGTPVETLIFPDQIHGFANQTALSEAPYAMRDGIAGYLRRRALAV
ncbi:alpha/beta hydrolase fold domain-containing protein [Alphaproteobacteria bacterium GH1-50]|uniref:Alpha/beta hydrolase fold domain-containing protein n=1 Tax=Kangsaoukella pontilimi TaxID=2691042 RepID=A0A7C9IEX5_9RHOB|nr:alpha/beta hydrolase [Kangsaoukella pontilimi]MXQ07124.1 alpha/beta hydrolase fold domain-containing protein [Kangsaoukella pontilimi]